MSGSIFDFYISLLFHTFFISFLVFDTPSTTNLPLQGRLAIFPPCLPFEHLDSLLEPSPCLTKTELRPLPARPQDLLLPLRPSHSATTSPTHTHSATQIDRRLQDRPVDLSLPRRPLRPPRPRHPISPPLQTFPSLLLSHTSSNSSQILLCTTTHPPKLKRCEPPSNITSILNWRRHGTKQTHLTVPVLDHSSPCLGNTRLHSS